MAKVSPRSRSDTAPTAAPAAAEAAPASAKATQNGTPWSTVRMPTV